jgi:hypothetical protein
MSKLMSSIRVLEWLVGINLVLTLVLFIAVFLIALPRG